jgi:3-oxoadipate enol-lactonase/4-carboxymuconolactone decarboxylase
MGQGPPLVLLPPLPGYKEAWIACAHQLARSFRVVTFDLRTRFTGPPTWDQLVGDLERVLDALAPGAVAVVGHSLGGALAQRWALRRPERVRALVLSSTFARVTTPRADRFARFVEQPLVLATQRLLPESLAAPLARRFAQRGAWVYDTACDDAVLGFVRHAIRYVGLGETRACLALAFAHDLRAELPGLSTPTWIVHGERESRFVREGADELMRLVPHAQRHVSPGVAHLHPLSGAAWLSARIDEWARSEIWQVQPGKRN